MRQSELCDVRAIASRDALRAAEAARSTDIPVSYASYEELLADPDIEAIYNPLPNHLHVEWSIRALEAGKHVLCEKPLARTAGEIEPLVKARDRTGLLIEEAVMVRDHPQWSRLRWLIDGGRIGALRNVQLSYSHFTDDPRDIRNQRAAGGGSLLDVGQLLLRDRSPDLRLRALARHCVAQSGPALRDRPLHDRAAGICRRTREFLLLDAKLALPDGADRRNDGLDTRRGAIRTSA